MLMVVGGCRVPGGRVYCRVFTIVVYSGYLLFLLIRFAGGIIIVVLLSCYAGYGGQPGRLVFFTGGGDVVTS